MFQIRISLLVLLSSFVDAQYVFLNSAAENTLSDFATSAKSDFPITDLFITSYNGRFGPKQTMTSGSCMVFTFSQIQAYTLVNTAYKPIADSTTLTCEGSTPDITCTKQGPPTSPDSNPGYVLRITLNADTTNIKTTVKSITNPFSTQQLRIDNIQYFEGCSLVTPTRKSIGSIYFGAFTPATLVSTFTTTNDGNSYVGDTRAANTATFTWTPPTKMQMEAGTIEIAAPVWYQAQNTYPFEAPCECKSSRFTVVPPSEINTQYSGSVTTKVLKLRYTNLNGAETDPFTLICTNWRNPIIPEADTGYYIRLYDSSGGQLISQTTSMTLDATNFKPYPIDPTSITFSNSIKFTRATTNMGVSFSAPVVLDQGQILVNNVLTQQTCYVKITFPKEFYTPNPASGLQIQGSNVMASISGGNNPTVVEQDFTTQSNQYMIIEGCKFSGTLTNGISLTFVNMINPYIVKTTDPFKIQIYKSYDSGTKTLSKEIQSITTAGTGTGQTQYEWPIDSNFFVKNPVTGVAVTASERQVQLPTVFTIKFTTATVIPKANQAPATNFENAVHVEFPGDFIAQNSFSTSAVTLQAGGSSLSVTTNIDRSTTYSTECTLKTCYTVTFQATSDIAANTEMTLTINNLIANPISIKPADNINITTMSRYTGDAQYYPIDGLDTAPGYSATRGQLNTAAMSVESGTGTGRTTYKPDQELKYKFVTISKVPLNGFFQFQLGKEFGINSESTAISRFQLVDTSTGRTTYASSYNVSATGSRIYIMCLVTREVAAGTALTATLAGIRNPRYTIENPTTADAFHATSYGTLGTYMIDQGIGGDYAINELNTFQSFSIENSNETNGAPNPFIITWYTSIETKTGDHIIVNFPTGTTFKSPTNNIKLQCDDLSGNKRNTYDCSYDGVQLIMKLGNIQEPTGTYKVKVSNVTNPPSFKPTVMPAGSIYHSTANKNQKVAEYKNSLTIQTAYGSQLEYLSGANITLSTKDTNKNPLDYSAQGITYTIKFQPYSVIVGNSLQVLLYYPADVAPTDSVPTCTVKKGDHVKFDGNEQGFRTSQCQWIEESRLFNITDAVVSNSQYNPNGFKGIVSIILKFNNPKNNWGTIGFKIKTFERVPTANPQQTGYQYYMVDKLEGNQLIPNLICEKPCKSCKSSPSLTFKNRNYCETCWLSQPQKYLMKRTDYNLADGTGNSTCAISCDPGYTSNGGNPQDGYFCVKCNPSCATCEDEGNVGDKDKCVTCNPTHPFLVQKTKKCEKSCGRGLYEIKPDVTQLADKNFTKACDLCELPCADCTGNRLNCTACDAASNVSGLFIFNPNLQPTGPQEPNRGTCLSKCPFGYYLDKTNPTDHICKKCSSPCATCEGSGVNCKSCDGTSAVKGDGKPRLFVTTYDNAATNYEPVNSCYNECPKGTSADMSNQRCLACKKNCQKCTKSNLCTLCVKPFLLQDADCVTKCTKPGYFPNNNGTMCINQVEVPFIGPLWTYITAPVCLMIVLSQWFQWRETQIFPTCIAFVGITEFLAIFTQIIMASLFNQERILACALISFLILILCNIYNWWFIKTYVISVDAEVEVAVKDDTLKDMCKKWRKRRKSREDYYKKMMENYKNKKTSSTSVALLIEEQKEDNDVGPGDSVSQQGKYEGGESDMESTSSFQYDGGEENAAGLDLHDVGIPPEDPYGDYKNAITLCDKDHIYKEGEWVSFMNHNDLKYDTDIGAFVKKKNIRDEGFYRWMKAYDTTAPVISWVSLAINFKFYRMTYSFLAGKLNFMVLFQKKKFKKHTLLLSTVSIFFIELVNIVACIVGFTQTPANQQMFMSCLDLFIHSVLLICLMAWELAKLDKYMKTKNTKVHKKRKSMAAVVSSDDNKEITDDDEDDDYPDWRVTAKDVVGNPFLFQNDERNMELGKIALRLDPRLAESWDSQRFRNLEEDPRLERSFPCTPREYKEYGGWDHGAYGNNIDNVYADAKEPNMRTIDREFSEVGTQAGQIDISTTLARKGGDLLTPGYDDKDDYSRKKGNKKKRGRKNKYYTQIDAEDDQEADQISHGSDEDGLDGIKEEDEEDEEEKARLRALAEKEEAERRKREEEERLKKEALEKEAAMLKAKREEEERRRREAQEQERIRKENQSDVQSELSLMMAQSNQMKKFGATGGNIIEVPPSAESRRFNECDIIGDLERDEKGNVVTKEDGKNGFKDKSGSQTNQRGYLVDENGDIVNNLNGEKMFGQDDLDDRGEVPAPFSIEKHNFNPHQVRGDFDFDRNGRAIVPQDPRNPGGFCDKRGSKVSSRGYRIDGENGIIDNNNRKKFDKTQTTSDGDLPKLFNYNGRRFDITDVIGQVDKDEKGEYIALSDNSGKTTDNVGRQINSRGYLVDQQGNVIDKDGKIIFEKKALKEDEIPKIFPFTKFNIKNILGDFEMDPVGNPILDKDKFGNLIDRQGRRVNSKGYLIDKNGNIINKHGKLVFEKEILDNENDIPRVFRSGLLKSDTASSLSRLMSEIGREPPSDGANQEDRASGATSEGGDMGITPADYNNQNMLPGRDMEDEEEGSDEEDGDEFDSEYGRIGGGQAQEAGVEMALKKRRRKKKKKKKKKVEMEDPSLREHLLAGAYGGVAKPKPKRIGVKYTIDLTSGLRDIATPGSAFMRDGKRGMVGSQSGIMGVAGGADSSKGRKMSNVMRSQRFDDLGSAVGSKKSRHFGESTSKLLNPQQREDQLKKETMEYIAKKKAAKRAKVAGKISKDADFEKMFGKDIDEFLEDSEFDIESIDKMSQFSKGSKGTIRSAAQAGRLRGLEKLYLQRIDGGTSMNKNAMKGTGGIMKPKQKFREGQEEDGQAQPNAQDFRDTK